MIIRTLYALASIIYLCILVSCGDRPAPVDPSGVQQAGGPSASLTPCPPDCDGPLDETDLDKIDDFLPLGIGSDCEDAYLLMETMIGEHRDWLDDPTTGEARFYYEPTGYAEVTNWQGSHGSAGHSVSDVYFGQLCF